MGSDSEPVSGFRWDSGRAYVHSLDAGEEIEGESRRSLRLGLRVSGFVTENSGGPRGALQIPPLRYPGFPVGLGGVVAIHAPFFAEGRIRGLVQSSVAGNPGTLRSG